MWKICFGDSDSYIDDYFSYVFDPQHMLVCVDHAQKLVAMMTLLPASLMLDHCQHQGVYVYAVATLPGYRNKGLMTQLQQKAEVYCQQMDYAFMTLVPAHRALFGMYRKLGYQAKCCLSHQKVSPSSYHEVAATSHITQITFIRFFEMRQQYLSTFDCPIQLGSDLNQYLYRQLTHEGNQILQVENHLGCGYVVCRKQGNALTIREVGMDYDCFSAAIGAVAAHFQVSSMHVCMPTGWKQPRSTRSPYGMIKIVNASLNLPNDWIPYMNLMLD